MNCPLNSRQHTPIRDQHRSAPQELVRRLFEESVTRCRRASKQTVSSLIPYRRGAVKGLTFACISNRPPHFQPRCDTATRMNYRHLVLPELMGAWHIVGLLLGLILPGQSRRERQFGCESANSRSPKPCCPSSRVAVLLRLRDTRPLVSTTSIVENLEHARHSGLCQDRDQSIV